MKLTRLQLRRLGKFEPALDLDLASGLNIVHGPNGSGKSALAASVRALLWPETLLANGLDFEAHWDDKGANVVASRSGRSVRWRRDGAESGPPSLPSIACAPCYTIQPADLAVGLGDTDSAIADEVRLRMAGGFDLVSILQDNHPVTERHGQAERAALEEARREHATVQNEFRELARKEEELEGLLGSLRIAENAQERRPYLQVSVQLAEQRESLDAASAALKGFPEGMDKLHGNELDRLADQEQEEDKIRVSCQEFEAKIAAAIRKAEEVELEGGPVSQADFEACAVRIRRMHELEGEIHAKETEKRQAQAALSQAWKELGGSSEVEDMKLDLPALAKLDSFLARAEVLRHTKSSLESNLQFLADGPETHELEMLRNGADALREWLSASKDGSWWQQKWMVAVVGAIGAVAGTFIKPYIPDEWHTAAPIAGALAFSLIPVGLGMIGKDGCWYAKHRFEKSKQKEPESWTRVAVQKRLSQLDQKLAKTEVDKQEAERRSLLRRQLADFEKEEAKHEEERRALKDTLGVDPGTSALGLVDLARRIQSWRGAKRLVEEADAALVNRREERDGVIADINRLLVAKGYPQAADAEEAEGRFENMRDRSQRLKNAVEDRDNCERQLKLNKERLEMLQAHRDGIYVAAGLQPGNKEELMRRIQRAGEYRNWKERENRLRSEVRAHAAKLEKFPELKELDIETARTREAEAQEESAKLAGISIEVGKIQERLERARQGRRLENSVSQLAQSRTALGARLHEKRLAEVGTILLGAVEQEFQEECMPEMLRRATEWVSEFTRRSFELVFVEGDQATFRVREASTGELREIAQLSDGSRAQVLLALRLAFATHSESGTQLPIFLDESLIGSDTLRFRSVAEALLGMIQSGRQVVYMTTRASDVAHWKAICSDLGQPEPHLLDLADLRGIEKPAVAAAIVQAPAVEVVEKPRELTDAEYRAQLDVPAPDPFAPTETLHLFHLLSDDLPTLHKLIDAGVETVGRWRSLARAGGAVELIGEEAGFGLKARAEAADRYFQAWREGRSRPVDRYVLEDSGVVSDEHLETIATIADEIHGDASQLLAALSGDRHEEVQGFFGKQLDQLRAFFEQRGFLDSRQALDDAAIKERVQKSVASHLRTGCLDNGDVDSLVAHLREELNTAIRTVAA